MTKVLNIPWLYKDERFTPGTVADVGHSFRLELSEISGKDEYRLYLFIRTLKCNGVKEELKRGVRVATFKKCSSLSDAQTRAERWITVWMEDALDDLGESILQTGHG